MSISSSCPRFLLLAALAAVPVLSQQPQSSQPAGQSTPAAQSAPAGQQPTPPPQPGMTPDDARKAKEQKAQEQLKQEEHQRILTVIPEFNTTNDPNAVSLTPKQKFELAFKGALDPFEFVAAAVDGAISQEEDDYVGYGQGLQGYAKRFGASYADSFDGAILGNAVFPVLLHEDPRYFRKGTGTIPNRIWYAVLSTVRCKNDSGKWVPNFGNIMGNLAAGGISNLYYPSTDRGAGLTISRAFTVTAEGALGALGYEFWPDVQRKFLNRHKATP